MRAICSALLWAGVAILAVAAQDSDARRLGAKSSSSSSSGSAVVKAEPRSSPDAGSALRYGAAAAVGAAAGHTTARAVTEAGKEEAEQGKSPAELAAEAEQQRVEKLTDLERKARAEELAKRSEQILKNGEERRKAELAAKQAAEKRHQDEANAKRAVEEEQRAEKKRQEQAREMSCAIKPVMSDAEIDHCKWAWSSPRS